MKRVTRFLIVALVSAFAFLPLVPAPADAGDVYVHGYTRSDGTYVRPHYRSSPDNSYNNNWSVQGNRNPHTGAYGTRSRTTNDHTPTYNRQHYGSPLYNNGGSNTLGGYGNQTLGGGNSLLGR